jgi:hypothetical protein
MGDANHSGADGGGLTFSTWINADLTSPSFLGWVYGFIVVKDNNGTDATDIACPHHHSWDDWSANNAWAGWTKSGSASFGFGPSTTAANYGGRWNHWAFVKAPHTLSWYCNGSLLKQEADTDANDGDPNIYGPLFPLPVSAFTIGLGGWGGNWAGYIDDFQVYEYALSTEVACQQPMELDISCCRWVPGKYQHGRVNITRNRPEPDSQLRRPCFDGG